MTVEVVTPKRAHLAWPQYGKHILVEPWQRLLVMSSRRSSFGGYLLTGGIPKHDGFLGEYVTPDQPLQFIIRRDLVKTISQGRVIQS